MGWNQGYSIMEKTVIAVYNTGSLTRELLNALMQPYRGTDIDHGGCHELRSNDGLTADEIVCKVMEPDAFAKIPAITGRMPDCVRSTEDGLYFVPGLESYQYGSWQEAIKNYRDSEIYILWRGITRREWDFW